MQKTKRIISLLVAAILLFSITACSPKGGDETTTAAATTAETTAAPVTGSGETTVSPSGVTGDSTTAPVGSTGNNVTTAAPTTQDSSGAPIGGTVEQILAYYNTKANQIKQEKNFSVHRTQDQKITFQEPGWAATIFNALLSSLNKVSEADDTFVDGLGTKRENNTPAKFITVKDQSYVSQLTAAGVKSATCVKDGDKVVVTIDLKDETCNAKVVPPHFGTCINNVTEDIINVKEVKISDDAMATYSNGQLKITVNSSGKVTQLVTRGEGLITGNVEKGTVPVPTIKGAAVKGTFIETFDITY